MPWWAELALGISTPTVRAVAAPSSAAHPPSSMDACSRRYLALTCPESSSLLARPCRTQKSATACLRWQVWRVCLTACFCSCRYFVTARQSASLTGCSRIDFRYRGAFAEYVVVDSSRVIIKPKCALFTTRSYLLLRAYTPLTLLTC